MRERKKVSQKLGQGSGKMVSVKVVRRMGSADSECGKTRGMKAIKIRVEQPENSGVIRCPQGSWNQFGGCPSCRVESLQQGR